MIADNIYDIIELRQPAWLLLSLIPLALLMIKMVGIQNQLPTAYFEKNMHYWYINHQQSYISQKRKHFILESLFWIFFSLALSGPEYPKSISSPTNDNGKQLLVLVDTSASMNTRDALPSRLLRVKSELLLMLNKLKPTEKFGVILFAGSSHILFPPTNDHDAARFYINLIEPGMLPFSGSLLVPALQTASKFLTENNSLADNAVILLISDGDVKQQETILTTLKDINIKHKVHTLGVGLKNDAPVPSSNESGGWLQTSSGEIITSNRNDSFLEQISRLTNGSYSVISDPGLSYFDNIISQSKSGTNRTESNWVQFYHLFLFVSALLLFYRFILSTEILK